jgi:hypothetical protein
MRWTVGRSTPPRTSLVLDSIPDVPMTREERMAEAAALRRSIDACR